MAIIMLNLRWNDDNKIKVWNGNPKDGNLQNVQALSDIEKKLAKRSYLSALARSYTDYMVSNQ